MINRKQLPYIDPQKWTQMIHMGYATEFVRLCNAEWDVDNPAPALLQPYLTAVLTAVAKEDQDYHVQQKSDLTPQIDEADKGRDGKLNQVLKMVDAMSVMTDMPQKQQAALTLKGPLDHYKPRADMAMSDETTQIQQWHEEFSASAAQQQAAQELGLTQIIADMMSETDRLVQLVAQRNIEMGHKREIQLTEDRQQTDLAIENFTQVLNALAVVDQDDERFNNIIDGLAGAQKTYRERFEEHARTVKRVKVMELGNSEGCNTGFDASTGTLSLDFVDAHSINAGHAYIVKWTTTGDPIENPVFHAVTIQNEDPADQSATSLDGSVTFKGTYDAIPFTDTDRSVLFLGSNNKLYWPQPDLSDPAHPVYPNIGAFRAYFQLNGGITASDVANARLSFGEDSEAQGITTTNYTNFTNSSGAWYTLDGVKLDKMPTRKGLYIQNGRVVVVK